MSQIISWIIIVPVVAWMLWVSACLMAGFLVWVFDIVVGEDAFEGLTAIHIVQPIKNRIKHRTIEHKVSSEVDELCASLNMKHRYNREVSDGESNQQT